MVPGFLTSGKPFAHPLTGEKTPRWDLAGLELAGVYGTWAGRGYALVNAEAEIMTLLMSAEKAPGPDWVHRTPDDVYGSYAVVTAGVRPPGIRNPDACDGCLRRPSKGQF
ncbi:MAG: hypothetical protein NVS2B15_10550 [Pseudarthrobacter sp.]